MSYIIQLTENRKPYPETTFFVAVNEHNIMMDSREKQEAKVYKNVSVANMDCFMINQYYDETDAKVIKL